MSPTTGKAQLTPKGSLNTMVKQHLMLFDLPWRGGRVVYGSGLENQRGCKPTVGSNPTLSVHKPSPRLGFSMSRRRLRPSVRYRCGDRNLAKRWHDSLIR